MGQGFWRKKHRGGAIWYTRIRYPDGQLVIKSTGCTDFQAAKLAKRRMERELMAEANDSSYKGKAYPLGQALFDFMADRKRRGRSEGTLDMYNKKSKHLVRILGGKTDINALHIQEVEAYVDIRLEEGASRHTVHKELTTFNGMLKTAKARGYLKRRPEDLKLHGFSAQYVPRDRRLSEEELVKVLAELPANRQRQVRFFVFTGASLGEARRCEKRDIDLDGGVLHLPGTKRETRRRRLPFKHLPRLADLLRELVDAVPEGQVRLLEPWENIRHDLRDACERAKIEPVSPNDLRRTFGSWLKNRGLDSAVIARLMGHSSTRMVDRVYGRLDDDTLARAMAQLADLTVGGALAKVEGNTSHGECSGQSALPGSKHGSSSTDSKGVCVAPGRSPVNTESLLELAAALRKQGFFKRKTKPATGDPVAGFVPRDRIELPTRGFSVPCSTD